MVAPTVEGIDLFKIAGRSISGWIPSLKTGAAVRQPFCSQLEERLMLWLEYHPQVKSYARGDIGPQFATTYRLPIPKHAPFAIGYTFEGKPHEYLPDVVGMLTNGKPFIAEAGMEDDKRGDRNLAKAEAARRLARFQQGVFWIGTERRLTKRRHYNLVFLHARRKTFPAFADIAAALQEVWPWGEMAPVSEVTIRLEHKFPANLVEAAIWKVVGDSAAQGHLLVDLEQFTLDRALPLALLPPDSPPLVPDPLPDTLLPEPLQEVVTISSESTRLIPGPTFDASRFPEPQREHFHRNLRAVSQVLAGATQTSVAEKEGIPRSTLGRLVRRTRQLGQIACVPHGSYRRQTTLHPAFQDCIRRLFLSPTRLSMTAIREHTEMQQVAARLSKDSGRPVNLPSYKQVCTEVNRLKMEPELVAMREGAKSVPRERESAESFVLSIPAPALLTQVDEHTMDLYVVTPDGTTVASRVHAAALICVKTAAILGAVLALGPLKEEDYMRLVKQSLERKDHLVGLAGCEHSWPCFGKPAIIFHDRGKIFTSERARQVLVDRLGIITEQAPPYAPSAKGTVESLFRWMTQRFERRLPNTSYGVHNAQSAAQAGGMTLEELERCFYQAVVDDYQQDWDELRRQRRCVLWEQAVAKSGAPQYLGSPDDMKLLLMKAVNRKTPHHGYRTSSGNRLSFQGRWYVCPGLLSRLRGREFDVHYDRRDVGVLYIFVEGEYVGEAYCPQFMGGRVSEWEAKAMRKHDEEQAKIAREQGLPVRARIQDEAGAARRRRLDKLDPFCQVAGLASEEVRDILATLEMVYQPLFPQLNLRQWAGSIYTWLTQPVLDPTHSGRVTMDNLMKLVTTALEWSYEAKDSDVKVERLKSAAELLVLRHDTLRIIDGAGPGAEAPPSESTEQGNGSGTETERAGHVSQSLSVRSAQTTSHDVAGDSARSTKATKCAFSGMVVPIELRQFQESSTRLVECPDCGAARTLEPHGGVLRFKSHDKRKTTAPNTRQRWARGKTDWDVAHG